MRVAAVVSVAAGLALVHVNSLAHADASLSMERAVEVALRQNAELTSLAAEVRAAEARVRGASLLLQSNPELSLAGGQRRDGAEKQAEYEAGVGQRLEIFGQRAARMEAARAARGVTAARFRSRRVEVAARVRETFARAVSAEALVKVARESLELARQSAAAAERRLELGDGNRMDVNTARVEIGRAAREVSLAEQRRRAALADIRLLLSLDATADLQLAEGLETLRLPTALPSTAALQKALAAHPDLEAARQELAEAGAEKRQAEREVLPSPRLEARYARDEGANIWLGGLSFELPLWNQNQGPKGVAQARVEQSTRALEAVERRVRQEVALATSRWELAQEGVRAYEGDVVKAMEENLKLVTAANLAGKVGLVELLVIRRDTLDARRGYVDARQELVAAAAELARSLGQERLSP